MEDWRGEKCLYTGEVFEGLAWGTGSMTSVTSGTKYVGSFANGLPNGVVVVTWPDGMRDEGEFKDGRLFGKGTRYHADGRVENCWYGKAVDITQRKHMAFYRNGQVNQKEAIEQDWKRSQDWKTWYTIW